MMSEEQFWQIVAELEWPTHHYDATKLTFMNRWPLETAGDFLDHFLNAKAALDRVIAEQWICDSWDDTKAHVVGLGRATWQAHIDDPSLLRRRMDQHDYVESFAYCIPTKHDYALLADDGYARAVQQYHQTFGPGYADRWPSHLGYLIPNIVSNLETYRLRVRVPEWNRTEGKRGLGRTVGFCDARFPIPFG